MTEEAQTPLSDLEAQQAELGRQIAARKAEDAAKAHFLDTNGDPITDKGALTDAVLVSAGTAMEARAKTLDWHDKSESDLSAELDAALASKDYIGVALAAATLNALKSMPATAD